MIVAPTTYDKKSNITYNGELFAEKKKYLSKVLAYYKFKEFINN